MIWPNRLKKKSDKYLSTKGWCQNKASHFNFFKVLSFYYMLVYVIRFEVPINFFCNQQISMAGWTKGPKVDVDRHQAPTECFFFRHMMLFFLAYHDFNNLIPTYLKSNMTSAAQWSKNVMKMAVEHSDFLFYSIKILTFVNFKVFYT